MALISSSTVRVRSSALYQPETNSSPYSPSFALRASGCLGNLLPISVPVKPASRVSRRQVSRGVSPPSSGRSSLLQAIGLVPSLTVMAASRFLVVTGSALGLIAAGLDIGRVGVTDLGALGHFGNGDIPPCAAGLAWSASGRCRSRRHRSVPTGGRAGAPVPVRRCWRPSRRWRPGCGHGRRSRSSYRRRGDRRSRIRLLKLSPPQARWSRLMQP